MTMELQLGLAPPNHLSKRFDLNSPKEMSLGSAMWGHGHEFCSNKRDFDEAFDAPQGPTKTLRLLWNERSDDDDDDDDDLSLLEGAHSFFQLNKTSIVGWPPIKASRKLGYGSGGVTEREEVISESKGGYVKVMMEGVAIGRKVDLTIHESYNSLTQTLTSMFGIYEEDGKAGPGYKLAYQDKQGDWTLVGDVPWGTFVQTVQRLKIQKRND